MLLRKTHRYQTKINLFIAIVINTAPWGCESLFVVYAKFVKTKFESFQHKSLQRILKISIYEVVEFWIKNSTIRCNVLNSPHIIDKIHACHLIWVGKLSKTNTEKIQRKMLAWCCWRNNKQRPGRLQLTFCNSFDDCLKKQFQTYSRIVSWNIGCLLWCKKICRS